jgi:hypothetical protein
MLTLEYDFNVSLRQVLEENKEVIVNSSFDLICKNYNDFYVVELLMLRIIIKGVTYEFTTNRRNFISLLEECISYFEEKEEYEKCKLSLLIIKRLNKINTFIKH